MGLKKYFQTSSKKNRVAIIDERLLICIEARNTDTVAALSDAIIKWKKYLAHKPQLKPWAIYKDRSHSHEVLYFTPYSAELFFKFYKQLIINHFPVPNTGGNTFHNTTVNVYLFYNTFSDTETTKSGRPVLDDCKKIGSYQGASVLTDRFSSILLTMFSLIFYKNYSPEYFQQSGVDADAVYTGCTAIATFLEKVYLSEHRIPKDLIATMPSNNQFQAGHGAGIYIPAFSAQSITISSAVSSSQSQSQSTSSSTSQSKSPSTSVSTSAKATNNSKNSDTSKESLETSEAAKGNMISLGKFRHNYFPMTNHPEIIEQGLQMLMEKRPDLFKSPVHFQKFHINKAKQVPASLDDALRTGQLDNQRYVIDSDNQFRRIANEIIAGRQNDLELKATNALIALVSGGYEKMSKKIFSLLSHANNDNALTASAQKYYDKYYHNGVAKYNKDEQVEKKTVKQAYYDEYKSKWAKEAVKIHNKYDNYRQHISDEINKDTGVLFIKGRQQRNKEVHIQANSIKQNDAKQLGLDIKKYQIHIGHKMAQSSKLIFEYLNYEYSAQHEKAKETVSELIKKQIQLNNSRINLKQAQIEVKSTKGNTKLDKKLRAEQKDEQKYINQLQSQCSDLRSKAKEYSSNSRQLRDKLKKSISQSRTLQNQLKTLNAQKMDAQRLQKQSKLNREKYHKEQSKNQKQQVAFNHLQKSMAAQGKRDAQQSYATSVKASKSASAVISQNDTNTYNKKLHLLNTIRTLRSTLKSSNTSTQAFQASNANQMDSNEALLHNAYKSLHSFKLSVSTSDSVRSSLTSSAQSQARYTQNSYVALINALQAQLSKANDNHAGLNNQTLQSYSKAVSSYGTFKASLLSNSQSISKSASDRARNYESIIGNLKRNQDKKATSTSVSPKMKQSLANQSYELSAAQTALATLRSSLRSSSVSQARANHAKAQNYIRNSMTSSIESSLSRSYSANHATRQSQQKTVAPNYSKPWDVANVPSTQYQQFSIQGDRQEKLKMEQQQLLQKTNQKYKQIQSPQTNKRRNTNILPWKN